MSRPVVALAGNPNCGKSTLFNALTGANAKVGNYPGVTVERREGRGRLPCGREIVLLDIPGTCSLSARSGEEQVAITAMAGLSPFPEPDVVVVVVDGSQLARNLYLLVQVLELRQPVVVALNMQDVLRSQRMRVDAAAISSALGGVPVVPISALRGEGLVELGRAVGALLARPEGQAAAPSGEAPRFPESAELSADLDAIAPEIPPGWSRGDDRRRRALALWALLSIDADDELTGLPDSLRRVVRERQARATAAGRDIDLEVVSERYRWIDEQLPKLAGPVPSTLRRVTDAIDAVLIHPVSGFAIFLGLMALLFESLFTWSGPLIDGVDLVIGALAEGVRAALPESLLRDLLTEGVITGVGAVVVFLPQILLLFLFLSIMEDSGYMARAAFLMDRVMKALGLTGRAFVPMLSGYACAIPAIMATRTMERRRDRMLTMMVVPIMTCSARLPVYTLIISALFPAKNQPGGLVAGLFSLQALILVGMYLFGTVLALLAAAVLGRTLFRGAGVPLLLELPPYRRPGLRTVLRMMWERSRLFVSEAGTVILVCTIVLWVLLTFPRAPELEAAAPQPGLTVAEQVLVDQQAAAAAEAERLASSWGGQLGQFIEPVIRPLGFDWKIGIGLIGAFAAREVFVSTMGVVYGVGEADEQSVPLRERLQHERWPDGRRVYTPLVGVSLLVFFALAAQCMSTLAVVRRETGGWGWPVFLFSYMTALAWLFSFAIYQGGRLLGWG